MAQDVLKVTPISSFKTGQHVQIELSLGGKKMSELGMLSLTNTEYDKLLNILRAGCVQTGTYLEEPTE